MLMLKASLDAYRLSALRFNQQASSRCISVTSSTLFWKSSSENKTEAQKDDDVIPQKAIENLSLTPKLKGYELVPVSDFLDKVKARLGFQVTKYPLFVLSNSAASIYLCMTYQIEYDKFYAMCQMPDVMYSFCLVTFFHIWMVCVALVPYGKDGTAIKRKLVESMWMDIEKRADKLKAPMNRKRKREVYTELNDIFRGVYLGMDEGLLGDDTVLAGAIWRHLCLHNKNMKDFAALGKICEYVRKNVVHLEENIREMDWCKWGLISFISLDEKTCDHSVQRIEMNKRIRNLKLYED